MTNRIRLIWMVWAAGIFAQHSWAQAPLKDITAAKWWTNRGIIRELKLSPDQQSKIETVFVQNRKILANQKLELDRRQSEFNAMLVKDTSDETALMRAFEEVQQARVSLERTTFQMRLQIKNLLNADQQPKIEGIAERLRKLKPNTATPAPVNQTSIKK